MEETIKDNPPAVERELSIADDIDLSYIDHPLSVYSKDMKIQACASYLLCGNVYQVADSLGIRSDVVAHWKSHSSWWPQLVDDMRKAKQDQLDAVLTTTIDTLTSKLSERLEIGDPYVKKDGTVGYLPIKAKDLAVTMAVLYDKRALIRGEATSIKKDSTESLKSLENKFKQFALSLKEKDVVDNQ